MEPKTLDVIRKKCTKVPIYNTPRQREGSYKQKLRGKLFKYRVKQETYLSEAARRKATLRNADPTLYLS